MDKLTITSTIKDYPHHSYADIKRKVIGAKYNLSLTFIGKTRAVTLNQNYRQKNYAPNILSFPLTEDTGEIFICPQVAKTEAAKFSLSFDGYVAFLFIHGLLHLKGLDHGDLMHKQEQKYVKFFNIS